MALKPLASREYANWTLLRIEWIIKGVNNSLIERMRPLMPFVSIPRTLATAVNFFHCSIASGIKRIVMITIIVNS